MNEFDKRIKKMSKEFQVPETYHKKVDEVLETIRGDRVPTPKKRIFTKMIAVMAALCLLITGVICFSGGEVAEASFLGSFKQTILDFLGISEGESKEMGIESDEQEAVSKPDLMIELQDVVMDTQNIYAMIKITAPPDVAFKEGMTFDYFGICEGANYDAAAVVPGARSCTLLEVLEGKANIATFILNISTDKEIEEGKPLTAFFQDLIEGPYEETAEVVVEGTWSLQFSSKYINMDHIVVKGTEEDMHYSLLGTTAQIEKIKILPLGITIVSDVSNVPIDTLNTSDTRVVIRLKMIDGNDLIVDSPNPEDELISSSGSVSEYEKNGKIYNKYVGQFDKAIDLNKVLGIYVGDCYVSIKEF